MLALVNKNASTWLYGGLNVNCTYTVVLNISSVNSNKDKFYV